MEEKFLIDKLKNAITIDEKRVAICNLNGYFGEDVYKKDKFITGNDEPQWVISAWDALMLLNNNMYKRELWVDIAKHNYNLLKSIAIDVILSHEKADIILKSLF